MNTNFIVIGWTRLGIKAEFAAPEADVLTTRPSELAPFPDWGSLQLQEKQEFIENAKIKNRGKYKLGVTRLPSSIQ